VRAPRQPLFLARRTYRRRRLIDAARLLPLLGTLLAAFPILWPAGDDAGVLVAREGIYLFVVWFGLVVAAFLLSRGLAPVVAQDAEGEEDG